MGWISRGVVVAVAAGVIAIVGGSASAASTRAETRAETRAALTAQVVSASRDILSSLASKTAAGDRQYFRGGVWVGDVPGYWFCDVGAGTLSAVLWRVEGRTDDALRLRAVETFDNAIAAHRNRNGSFGSPGDSPDIETMSFGVQLGMAYRELAPSLDSRTRHRWQGALTGAADYLIRNGNLGWYTNGNINLANAELFYLAWRETGQARFRAAYQAAWQFALDPPQARWPGFGLHLEGGGFPAALPTSKAGSVAGYLAESGGGEPGFDADYTVVQLDAAAGLYLFSGDPRAKELAELLANALLPRVDGSGLLDTSNGTRHPDAGRKIPFLSSGIAVLAWRAGRPAAYSAALATQLQTLISTYKQATSYGYSPYLYRGLGTQLAVVALAGARVQPLRDS